MSAYCVDFNSGSDWYAPASQSDSFYDFAAGCSRGWVVIQSHEFQAIYNASQTGTGGTTSPQFTETEVAALKWQAANPSPFNLSIPDGALVGGAIVATWAVAWGLRQLVQTLGVSDGNSSE